MMDEDTIKKINYHWSRSYVINILNARWIFLNLPDHGTTVLSKGRWLGHLCNEDGQVNISSDVTFYDMLDQKECDHCHTTVPNHIKCIAKLMALDHDM